MLPEGWIETALEGHVRIHSGMAPGELDLAATGPIPYVKVEDLNNCDKYQFESREYLQSCRAVAPAQSLIFPKRGAAIFANKVRMAGRPMVLDTNLMAVEVLGDIDPEFFFYAIAFAGLHKLADISTIPQLNNKHVYPHRLARPSLAEQQRVALVLSSWDEAITTTESLLANRREQWRALLALTLHLPPANPAPSVCDNGGYSASVQPGIPSLPATPEGWQRISLGRHLTEVRRPATLSADEAYRLVTVKRSRGGVELRETLTGREIKTPTQFYVRTGDFLISKRQIVHGACGIVPDELDGAVVSNEYAVLNTDGQIDLRFLRYLSESRYFQQTCFHSSIGVHVEKMIFKTERWLKWPFNIPPLPVQLRIVEVLDTARREVELIAAQIERLKQEKAALMADLLTGKRRVRTGFEGAFAP